MSDDSVYCPTCNKDGFDSIKRMVYHHNQSHMFEVRRTEICEYCDNIFVPTNSENPNKYCDEICFGLSQQKNPEQISSGTRGTTEYREWTKTIHNLYDVCQECSSTDNLQAHHIVPVSENKDLATDVDNGILLCGKCHSNNHENLAEELFLK